MAGTSFPNGISVPQVNLTVLSDFALLKTENAMDYVKEFQDVAKDSFIMKSIASGNAKYTPQQTFRQYYDDNKMVQGFKVVADVSSITAGAAITVTLSSLSHEQGGKYSPVALGQIYKNDVNDTEWEVRAINKSVAGAHTATIAPAQAATVPAVVAATAYFILQGYNSTKEAGSQRDGVYKFWGKRERSLQILNTYKSYTDLAMFEKIEQGDQSYYAIDKTNIEPEHMVTEELTLVFGKAKDNLTLAVGNKNTTAQGMLPQIQALGTYMPGAIINKAFFQDMKRANDADGFTNKYEVLADTEFQILYQDFLVSEGVANNIRVEISPKDKEIQAVFDYADTVKYYGVEISLKNYPFFNSARYADAPINTGFWRKTAVWLPVGTRNVNEGEGGGVVSVPYYRVRYMSDSEGGQMNFLNTSGALLSPTSSTTREANISLTSYKGLEMYGLKSFKLVKLA